MVLDLTDSEDQSVDSSEMQSQDIQRAILNLLLGAAPERSNEILSIWDQCAPKVKVVPDQKGITISSNGNRIKFDLKSIDVLWLIGFSSWKVFECYTPPVIVAASTWQNLSKVMTEDEGLAEIEMVSKQRRSSFQHLIQSSCIDASPWPDDIPKPLSDRNLLSSEQEKAAFDLTLSAIAFIFFHELRHVMFAHHDNQPKDRREEELLCDIWGRQMMIPNIERFAKSTGHSYESVLRRRGMALALAAYILHEITPFIDRAGTNDYYSVVIRIQAVADEINLPPDDPFWLQLTSLLVGIFRQEHIDFDPEPQSPMELTKYFLLKLEAHLSV